MATVQDILYDARALHDSYNEDGIVLPSSDVAQEEVNGLRYINLALQEAYKMLRYYKSYSFTQTPTEAQLEARKWILYTLPADFGTLEQIVVDDENRTVLTTYRIEEHNKLYIPFTISGDIKVVYMPKLTRLTMMTDEIPNNNPVAEQFIVYYTASKMALASNPSAVSFFEQKANELKMEAMRKEPASFIQITDVYAGYNYN